jgi:hypothetical protein
MKSPSVLVLALTAVASRAWAAQYYAAPDGQDCNMGNKASPWSLARAVSADGAKAGDTVWIRGGNYSGGFQVANSGTSGAWITFAAYPGELPIIDGGGMGGVGFGSNTAQYVRVVGLAARNFKASGFANGWTDSDCVTKSNGNWQFINVIADNNGINGVAFYCAPNIALDQSIVAHNGAVLPSWSSGVCLYNLFGDHTTNVISRTVAFENVDVSDYHSDGSGFICDEPGSGATFVNNIGFRNGGSCIRSNCPDTYIINNTCYHDGIDPTTALGGGPTNPGELNFSHGTMGAVFSNNILIGAGWDNKQQGVNATADATNYTVDYGGAFSYFTNPAAFDFRLISSATVAINKGTTNNAPSTDIGFDPKCLKSMSATGQPLSWWTTAVDYSYVASVGGVAGCFHPNKRPAGGAPDMGAYEYNSTPVSTGGAGGGPGAGDTNTYCPTPPAGGSGGSGGGSGAAGAGGSSATGAAGSSATGAAGSSATGAAGHAPTGAAGSSATGAAGGSATGAAGGSATGAAGSSATGAAGSSATGAAGHAPTGAAGSSGGSSGGGKSGGSSCDVGGTTGAGGLALVILGLAALAVRGRRRVEALARRRRTR